MYSRYTTPILDPVDDSRFTKAIVKPSERERVRGAKFSADSLRESETGRTCIEPSATTTVRY